MREEEYTKDNLELGHFILHLQLVYSCVRGCIRGVGAVRMAVEVFVGSKIESSPAIAYEFKK